MKIHVIGAGMAGCEAAWQAGESGIDVRLYEMKPKHFSPAHHSADFAELVCSNSFKAMNLEAASGLLKAEMELLHSLLISCAKACAVPAGGALAVDRNRFSQMVTERIALHPRIEVVREEIVSIADFENMEAGPVIIATGPLTADCLADSIRQVCGTESLSFFDAAAPVVLADSIDMDRAFRGARYGRGTADYINCPMDRETYLAFYQALITAETAAVKEFDALHLYEGCMPVECMAARGVDTLRFGPLKPVGLNHPRTGESYYAVVQLRQDDLSAEMYNMVGFQTRLKFPEQKRVFGMIPALAHAEYARLGVMHRNTYLRAPGFLDGTYRMIEDLRRIGRPVYFAGQMTGVEGYMESAASGLTAGLNAARLVLQKEPLLFPKDTAVGALAHYVSSWKGKDYQPMGIHFGLLAHDQPIWDHKVKKQDKKRIIAEHALQQMQRVLAQINMPKES